MTDAAVEPLHRFPVFRTSDAEELRHFGSTLFGASSIDLKDTGGFQACVNLVQLQETALAFGATTSRLTAHHVSSDFIRLQIAMKGQANTSARGVTTDINARQLAITPSDVRSQTVCEAGHERLTVRLNEQSLLRRLTMLLGVKPKGVLTFQTAIVADGAYARSLCQLIAFFSQQLDATASRLPVAACRELEQAMQIAFLWASRHTFSHLLESEESKPAPDVVRRLEEFIEAHWRDAITIERLVAEAGISARSVFRAFDRSRGYSPMAFVKAVRLRHARETLLSGNPDVGVTATAFRCNFASPGHFARHYREAFGELPSETIARMRS